MLSLTVKVQTWYKSCPNKQNCAASHLSGNCHRKYGTVKILKFGTPQTIAIIVLKIEKFDVTLH